MLYPLLKITHIGAATISFCGFVARGIGILRGDSWVRHSAARRLPHLVDSVLLLAGLGMLWLVRLSPWAVPWLRAKIIALALYIALGSLALRGMARHAGRPRVGPVAAWLAALTVFAYIVSIALTKDARGALTLL